MNKKNDVHDFHMVMTYDLKARIIKLSDNLNKSKSDTVVYIINKCFNKFKKCLYKTDEMQCISNYQKISWDEELHIYFDKKLYRKIKHLCAIGFIFSMASLVRWLINYYFEKIYDEKNNNENIEEIEKINKEVNKHEFSIKKWNKIIVKKQLSGKFYYQLSFNDEFSVIGFNFYPPE